MFELSAFIDKDGVVPIVITATCKDEFGQFPPYKWPRDVFVEAKPSPSSIGSQTYYYGPVTGPAHSGIGHINMDNKSDEEE